MGLNLHWNVWLIQSPGSQKARNHPGLVVSGWLTDPSPLAFQCRRASPTCTLAARTWACVAAAWCSSPASPKASWRSSLRWPPPCPPPPTRPPGPSTSSTATSTVGTPGRVKQRLKWDNNRRLYYSFLFSPQAWASSACGSSRGTRCTTAPTTTLRPTTPRRSTWCCSAWRSRTRPSWGTSPTGWTCWRPSTCRRRTSVRSYYRLKYCEWTFKNWKMLINVQLKKLIKYLKRSDKKVAK